MLILSHVISQHLNHGCDYVCKSEHITVLHSWCWIAAELRQTKDGHITKANEQTLHPSILLYVEGWKGQQYSGQDMNWMTGKLQLDLL